MVQYRDGKFTSLTKKDGLLSDSIFAVYEDTDGSIWIGTDSGLNHYQDGKITALTRKDGLIGEFAYPVIRDKNGVLWIGTDGGLNRWENGQMTSYTKENGLMADSIWALLEDRDKNLWIGSRNGLHRFRDGKFSSFTTKNGLSNDAIWSLCEDREGNLWIGTRGGLNRLRDGKFTTFTSKEGLPGDVGSSIFEDSTGAFWFGTDGSGLAHYQNDDFTIYTTENGLSNNSVFCIREDKNQNMWFGTNAGVNRLSNEKWTTYLKDSIVWTLAVDSANQVWIGTRNGLVKENLGQFTIFTTEHGLTSNEIWELLAAKKDRLWIGAYNGLNYYENGKFVPLNSHSKSPVTSLYQEKNGTLWIGTNGGGLQRYKDEKFFQFTTKNGLPDDSIFETLEDDHGHFWISSSKGIFRIRRKELEDMANGEEASLSIVAFGRPDGLKSSVSNDGSYSAWKGSDGRLWFSTMKGVTVIDPSAMKSNDVPPPVFIEEVVVNERPAFNELDPLRYMDFPPGSEKLEFQYTGLSLFAPEEVNFMYKLEGFDTHWITAGRRRTAYYTNIPPGNYTFRVIAENNDGVWNRKGATFAFYIQPHFYQTYWFYALLAALAALTVFAGYRLRVRQMRSREKELLHLVEERTRELERKNAMLQQISYLDSVTGVFNRRRFDEVLDMEWRRAYRNRSFFSCIMIDIDLFKPFNDAYGHQVGDSCLKQVAAALNSQLRRAGDFIARYGGEEFVILLPGAGPENAISVAERLRTTVESLGIPHQTSSVKNVVTISLGLATARVDHHTQ